MTFPLTRSRSRARFFGVPFTPASLFANGEQGAWYDPSDGATIFEDRAGTTPCRVPGAGSGPIPVGLMLDERNPSYSVLFSAASLSTPNSVDLQLGSTYTVECWAYRTGTGTNIRIFSDGSTNANNVDIYIATTTNNVSFFGGFTTSTYALQQNVWTHLALVVTAGVPAFYADGVAQTLSGTLTGVNSTATTTRHVGALAGGFVFQGYISNLRVVKGTAVYTGNFTPPITPLTAISGTSLLTCGASWSGNPAITNNGAIADKFNPFNTGTGNHAFAANDTTARPELSARVNLLTYTEQFDNGAWTKGALTVTANATPAPDGTTTADLLVPTATTAGHFFYNATAVATTSGVSYRCYVRLKAAGYNFAVVALNVTASYVNSVCINLTDGTLSNQGASGTYSVTNEGNGWWGVTVTGTASAASGYLEIWPRETAGGTGSTTGNGTSGIYAWGADLRPTNIGANLPAYQRVVDQYTYDNAGFPVRLLGNGTSTAMSTAAIDFTATDKMTVFAGVTKLSDANFGTAAELSVEATANAGTFIVRAPQGAPAANYAFFHRGSVTLADATTPANYTAPITNVISGLSNLGAPSVSIRVNGAQVASSSSSGGGNFGNYPLYLFARNNASLFFNGSLYSLIIRGAQSTAGEISATENWVNGKTGAY